MPCSPSIRNSWGGRDSRTDAPEIGEKDAWNKAEIVSILCQISNPSE